MNNRHSQWPAIIAAVQPATIIEIGSHRGATAEILVKEARKYSHRVRYSGFDLFRAKLARSPLDIALGKFKEPRFSVAEKRLAPLRRAGVNFALYSGPTSQTLHPAPRTADLVFIDGAYDAETISADYAAVAGSGCIILNNWFMSTSAALLPEAFRHLGCNRLESEGKVLPELDQFPEFGIGVKFLGVGLPEGVV